jgi:hypothetical protein
MSAIVLSTSIRARTSDRQATLHQVSVRTHRLPASAMITCASPRTARHGRQRALLADVRYADERTSGGRHFVGWVGHLGSFR